MEKKTFENNGIENGYHDETRRIDKKTETLLLLYKKVTESVSQLFSHFSRQDQVYYPAHKFWIFDFVYLFWLKNFQLYKYYNTVRSILKQLDPYTTKKVFFYEIFVIRKIARPVGFKVWVF